MILSVSLSATIAIISKRMQLRARMVFEVCVGLTTLRPPTSFTREGLEFGVWVWGFRGPPFG